MKKLILDSKKFNLMMERMENKYTLEETINKKRNLILEGFPKGVVGEILSGIGKNAEEIQSALKKVKVLIGSAEEQNFMRGLNFFEDPLENISEWKNVSMGTFVGTLKKLNNTISTDVILKKLNSVSEVAAEIEKGGNPIKNLIQTIDNAGLGLEEVENIVEDTLEMYPDMFKNSDIQPVNGSKIFKEGDSASNFVRRSIIRENGSFVDGVPQRTQNRIVGEYLKDGKGKPDIQTKGGPDDGEEILVDPDTGLTYYGKAKETMKKILGSKAVKVIWKYSGMDLWWRAIGGKKLFSKTKDPIEKSAKNVLKEYGMGGLRIARVGIMGTTVPLPPALYYMLYDCIASGYFGNGDRVVQDLDKPLVDGKIQVKDYEFSFWECIGASPQYDPTTGKRIFGPAGNAQLAWPIATLFVPTIAENLATQYLSNPVKRGIREGEEILNKELENIFKIDYSDLKNSFKTLLKTKCDGGTIEPLKNQFLNRLQEMTNLDGQGWARVLQVWPTDYGDNWSKKLNLNQEQTDKVLEIFGDIETLREFQNGLKEQYKEFIPEGKGNDTLTIGDMVKYKCQAMRINAITKVVEELKGEKYWFPKETQITKNKNSEHCDNINFWISLSTPIGSEEWSNQECMDMTNEVTEISNLINSIPIYDEVKTDNTMLDPSVWEKTCKDLNDIMSDGNTELLDWLCKTGAETGVADLEVEVEEIEVIVYNYKWEKYVEDNQVITTAQKMVDTLNNKAAKEGSYLIVPNEEGSGLTEDESGNREYDLCNPNVQKVWIDDYWCKSNNITKVGIDSGKTTKNCVDKFKEYLKEENIC
jgi:hypothetical protein